MTIIDKKEGSKMLRWRESRRKRKNKASFLFFIFTFFFGVFLVSSPHALAALLVDQSNDFTPTLFMDSGIYVLLSQVFTPIHPNVAKVDIRIHACNIESLNLTIKLNQDNDEIPLNWPTMASATTPVVGACDPYNGQIVSFTFSPPVTVIPGDKYSIAWTPPDNTFSWAVTNPPIVEPPPIDIYPGGNFWIGGQEQAPPVDLIRDAAFITYWDDEYTPPPLPTYYTLIYGVDSASIGFGTINGSTSPLSQTVLAGNDGSPVKAIPFPGYTFIGWSGGRTDNPRTDTNVTGPITVTANFSPIDRTNTLLTTANPPGGTYNTSQIVDLAQISGPAGTIYFTTNGTTDPCTCSSPTCTYSTGISINTNTTLKFASKSGTACEPVKTEVYTINSTLVGSVSPTPGYPAGNIPVTVTFPAISNTIKPDCINNTHFELFPCDLNSITCDPLLSLCRIRTAYGWSDVGNINAGDTLVCNLGDMYDPRILNQLISGSYTVKVTYAQHIPFNLNLNDPKPLWTGAIDLTPVSKTTISLYKFNGFLPPIDNPPVWNIAQAGRTIPIKWQLEGESGLPWDKEATLTATVVGSNTSVFSCPGSTVEIEDNIESYSDNTQSILKCDPVTGTCQYNWKTSKTYAGLCGSFTLKLSDGTERKANFEFKTK
jgi:uncharacterized repeat protein (TIGR02543 family)